MFQNWKATPRSRAERAVIPQKSRLPSARSQNASSKTRSTWMVGARLGLRVRARVGLRVRATATATARVRVRARVARVRSTLLSVPKPSRWMAFFDVDEFVRLSPRYASLHSVLAHVLDAAQALG